MQITSDEAEITYIIHIRISKKELEEFLVQLDNLLEDGSSVETDLVADLYNAFIEYTGEK